MNSISGGGGGVFNLIISSLWELFGMKLNFQLISRKLDYSGTQNSSTPTDVWSIFR